jgi:RhtB (resistance to homoserine/threonine) family protein
MFDSQVFAFAIAAALLTVAPGVDTMLVVRNTLTRGVNAGLITTLGVCLGTFVHAAFSALGLSVILLQSANAWGILKFAGASYLVYLGIRSLIQAFSTKPTSIETVSSRKSQIVFLEGLLNNILNPKTAVFYLAFLPQFIDANDPVIAKSMLLACIHFLEAIVWLSVVVLFVGKIRVWLNSPKVKRSLEAVTGVLFIGFGVRLMFEKR